MRNVKLFLKKGGGDFSDTSGLVCMIIIMCRHGQWVELVGFSWNESLEKLTLRLKGGLCDGKGMGKETKELGLIYCCLLCCLADCCCCFCCCCCCCLFISFACSTFLAICFSATADISAIQGCSFTLDRGIR